MGRGERVREVFRRTSATRTREHRGVANSIGAFYAMCALSGMNIAAAHFPTPACEGMETQLNKLGKEGWELVSVCPTDSSGYYLRLLM